MQHHHPKIIRPDAHLRILCMIVLPIFSITAIIAWVTSAASTTSLQRIITIQTQTQTSTTLLECNNTGPKTETETAPTTCACPACMQCPACTNSITSSRSSRDSRDSGNAGGALADDDGDESASKDIACDRPYQLLKGPDLRNKRIMMRFGGLTSEGAGSFLQHFKDSILFSLCVRAELMVAPMRTGHNYSTAGLFNDEVWWNTLELRQPLCEVGPIIERHGGIMGVLDKCFGTGTEPLEASEILEETRECGTFVHQKTSTTMEPIQNLNHLVEGWVRVRLRGLYNSLPCPTGQWRAGHVRVGVHMRWGNTHLLPQGTTTATEADAENPDPGRAITWEQANMALAVIMDCAAAANVKVHVRLFAEGMAEGVPARHLAVPVSLENGHDSLRDMAELSTADILILGKSSYGALVLMLARTLRVAFVPSPSFPKFANMSREGRLVVPYDAKSIPGICAAILGTEEESGSVVANDGGEGDSDATRVEEVVDPVDVLPGHEE